MSNLFFFFHECSSLCSVLRYICILRCKTGLVSLSIQDVGQSILESYSRVTESLAFNIIARIDDVIYVDDAMKRCASVDSTSIFSRGGLGGVPIQKRMSPSPFSMKHTPYGSPFATPSFTPISGSPQRKSSSEAPQKKASAVVATTAADHEKVWSYAGNLSSRRLSTGDAPERD